MADSTEQQASKAAGSKPAAAQEKEKPAAPAPISNPPTVFPKSTHLANAKGMYGKARHVVAGAIRLLEIEGKGDPLTKENVAGAVDRFLEREIA